MKLGELRKLQRQSAPKRELLVLDEPMEALCESGNQIHAHHSFESPLSNYCTRCQRIAMDGVFLEPIASSQKEAEDSCSPPTPNREKPTSSTSTKSTAPAEALEVDSASTSRSSQLSLNL